jgi:hypothetical protein
VTKAVGRAVPVVVVALSILVIASGLVLLFLGAWTTGTTWDEKTHVAFLQSYFDSGWNTDPIAIVNDVPDPRYIWGVYVYGPVAELISHAVSVLFGAESWGKPVFDAFSSSTRHVGTALSAVIGIATVGGIVRTITRSWRWGIVAAAMAAATPLWIGHGMFNIKDTPVAAGYTLATLGVVMLLRDGSWPRWRPPVWGAVFLLLGTVLAAGTRAASGVPIAAAACIGALTWWLLVGRSVGWRSSLRDAGLRLGWMAGVLVIAYLALVALYPKAFANPFVLAWEALVVSARFPFDELVLTSGTWMDQPPPWTYLPLWFGAQLPLLVLAGALGFAVLWVVLIVQGLRGRFGVLDGAGLAAVGVVVLQVVLLPALAILGRSNMYNGQRQFLFVVPAAVALAALGVWALHRWLATRWPDRRALMAAFWSIVAVGIVAPLVSQALLFPYNYTYYNALVASQPLEEHWPTDYWRASSRELWERLPAGGPEACAYESYRYDRVKQCVDEGMFQPYLADRGASALPGTLEPGQIWMVRENQGMTELPEGCALHDQITRPLFGQEIVIGQILRCDLPAGWSVSDPAS